MTATKHSTLSPSARPAAVTVLIALSLPFVCTGDVNATTFAGTPHGARQDRRQGDYGATKARAQVARLVAQLPESSKDWLFPDMEITLIVSGSADRQTGHKVGTVAIFETSATYAEVVDYYRSLADLDPTHLHIIEMDGQIAITFQDGALTVTSDDGKTRVVLSVALPPAVP